MNMVTVTEAYEDLAWEEGLVPDDGPSVSYPITLLLDRLQAEIGAIRQDLVRHLDRIEAKLDAKADRADVVALEKRVALLEVSSERNAAEANVIRDHQQVARTWKQYVPTVAIGCITVVVLILQLVKH